MDFRPHSRIPMFNGACQRFFSFLLELTFNYFSLFLVHFSLNGFEMLIWQQLKIPKLIITIPILKLLHLHFVKQHLFPHEILVLLDLLGTWGWKWLKMAGMAEIGWKWLEISRND